MVALHSTLAADVCGDETHVEDVKQSLLPTKTTIEMAELFKALGDPTRLRIISLLLDHELCVHTIEEAMGMTQSAVSHQLRFLRELRLVRARKVGRHVYYALDDDHVSVLFQQGLLHVQHQA